jgi:hypothetical protein
MKALFDLLSGGALGYAVMVAICIAVVANLTATNYSAGLEILSTGLRVSRPLMTGISAALGFAVTVWLHGGNLLTKAENLILVATYRVGPFVAIVAIHWCQSSASAHVAATDTPIERLPSGLARSGRAGSRLRCLFAVLQRDGGRDPRRSWRNLEDPVRLGLHPPERRRPCLSGRDPRGGHRVLAVDLPAAARGGNREDDPGKKGLIGKPRDHLGTRSPTRADWGGAVDRRTRAPGSSSGRPDRGSSVSDALSRLLNHRRGGLLGCDG